MGAAGCGAGAAGLLTRNVAIRASWSKMSSPDFAGCCCCCCWVGALDATDAARTGGGLTVTAGAAGCAGAGGAGGGGGAGGAEGARAGTTGGEEAAWFLELGRLVQASSSKPLTTGAAVPDLAGSAAGLEFDCCTASGLATNGDEVRLI